MLDKIAQILANPTAAITRDTSVRAGNTVWVNVNRKVVQAIAVNDINSSNVMIAWSETDQRYYAVSASMPVEISSETTELDSSVVIAPPELIALFYIVVIEPPLRYSENVEDIGLTNAARFAYYSFLFATENQLIINITYANPESVTAQKYDGLTSTNSFVNYFFFLYNLANKYETFSNGEVIFLGSLVPDLIGTITIRSLISEEQGAPIQGLIDATLARTGENPSSYDYIITDDIGGDRTETIEVNRFLSTNLSTAILMFQNTQTFGQFNRNTDYCAWFISVDDVGWAVDTFDGVIDPFLTTSAMLLPLTLQRDSVASTWTKDYSYSSPGGQYPNLTYSKKDEIEGTSAIAINSNTFNWTAFKVGTGGFSVLWEQDFVFVDNETADCPQYAGYIELSGLSFNYTANTYSYSDLTTVTHSVDVVKNLDYRSVAAASGVTLIPTALTMSFMADWSYSKAYTNSSSFSDVFEFGSLSVPLIESYSSSLTYNETDTVSSSSVQTSEPINREIAWTDEVQRIAISHDENASASFVLDSVWNFPKSTSSSQSISRAENLVKVLTSSQTAMLYGKLDYSVAGTYTHSFTATPRFNWFGDVNMVDEPALLPEWFLVRFQSSFVNPIDVSAQNDSCRINVTSLFFEDMDELLKIAPLDMTFAAFEITQNSDFERIATLNVSSLSYDFKLAYFDGNTSIDLNTANSLYGRNVFLSVTGSTITINNASLFGVKGSARDTIPTTYTYTTTQTGPVLSTTTNYDETTGTPYIDINSFIGINFLVFDSSTKILYTATLTTATPLTAQGQSNLTLTIVSQEEMLADSFLVDSGNNSLLVTKENLTAAIANIPEIQRRISLKEGKLFLCYFTNPVEVDEQQYVHEFSISRQNIVYDQETLANINSAVDDNSSYRSKQYAP